MGMDWQQRRDEIDLLITQAQIEEAQALLESENPRKIPKLWAVAFAELCFRAKLPLYGLKTLHRFVQPKNSLAPPATSKEKMLYATLLYNLGAVSEMKSLLHEMDPTQEPEALYYQAVVNFYEWNYSESLKPLREYISSAAVSNYRKLVGRINLLAAFVNMNDLESAEKEIQELENLQELQKHSLLLGNLCELKGQLMIFQRRWQEAQDSLNRSEAIFQNHGGLYLLFVEKWKAIIECLKTPIDKNFHELHRISGKAREMGHWNTVRECDLFEAIASRNEFLLRKLIMGTPFESYRNRARKLFGSNFLASGKFQWDIGEAALESSVNMASPVFDPYQKSSQGEGLYEKPLLLSAFEALCADFYQPRSLGALFSHVYPSEKFNPFTSPARVLRLLERLDQWFQENHLPLRVQFKKSEFALCSLERIQVVVQRGKRLTATDGKLAQLKTHFGHREFSRQKAAEALEISPSSAQQLLNEALKQRKLFKSGRQRGSCYRFSSPRAKRSAA